MLSNTDKTGIPLSMKTRRWRPFWHSGRRHLHAQSPVHDDGELLRMDGGGIGTFPGPSNTRPVPISETRRADCAPSPNAAARRWSSTWAVTSMQATKAAGSAWSAGALRSSAVAWSRDQIRVGYAAGPGAEQCRGAVALRLVSSQRCARTIAACGSSLLPMYSSVGHTPCGHATDDGNRERRRSRAQRVASSSAADQAPPHRARIPTTSVTPLLL